MVRVLARDTKGRRFDSYSLSSCAMGQTDGWVVLLQNVPIRREVGSIIKLMSHQLVLEPLVSLRLVFLHLGFPLLSSDVPLPVIVELSVFLGLQHLRLGPLILLLQLHRPTTRQLRMWRNSNPNSNAAGIR